MIKYKEISVELNNTVFYTKGLTSYIGKELRLSVVNHDKDDYLEVIKYIIDYIIGSNATILKDQNISYYSWLLQFKVNEQNYFDIYEPNKNGSDINKGCDLAIEIIKNQSETCAEYQLIPLFPNFNQMIVISKGVYEGKDIEAIRYDSPDHMSGWWLITDDYDDNIKSLMTVHYYHVAFKRPDLLKYLALPFGYRFYLENNKIKIMKDE